MDAGQRRELQRAMARLADGDREAFHPVFVLAWPVVLAFARSFLRRSPDADDVAQQALIRSFERACRFDPSRDALSWLLGIVANECRSARRQQRRRREEPLGYASALHAETSIEADLVAADLERAAMEVLGSLPAADVRLIIQAAETGTAGPLDLTASALRKRLERARRRLRAAWKARHGTC